jgi:hypothetical protein
MRKSSVLGLLTAANFMTASMGLPLAGEGGKFSASNIAPVLFCAVAGVLFLARRRRIDRRVIWFFLSFNLAALLSFVIFLLRFRWDPNLPVLLFQDVELLFCLLLLWYAKENPEAFRDAVRAGIYSSFVVLAYYGWQDLHDSDLQWSLGMDDKSHTAVLLCCEAYILIRFFGGKLDHLAAFALVMLSLLTISREPIFLVPGVLLAASARSRYGAALTVLLGCGVAIAFATYGEALLDVFAVFDRLTSVDRVTGESSTVVHFLLLKSALVVKFSDPWCFFFGIGPGNFSKSLATFQFFLPEIRGVDPVLAEAALEGRAAPMHSVPVSLLIDMNIVFVLLCLYLLMKAVRYLLRPGHRVDLAFLFCLLAASMFYSLHNKPYIYLIVTTLMILMQSERLREPAPAAAPTLITPAGAAVQPAD